MFVVNDADIEFVESMLLPRGMTFDDERRNFIRSMETLDVHAVPGSGKTTSLLAKLAILERQMPFSDGGGVLVLSHTNTAVDEIRSCLASRSPKLFEFPSFVGTVQSFVDTFLAIPYYKNTYGRSTLRIDGEIYEEELNRRLNRCLAGERNVVYRKVAYIRNSIWSTVKQIRFGTDENENVTLIDRMGGAKVSISKPGRNARNYVDFTDEEKAEILAYLLKVKTQMVNDGCLHYDDAYFLGRRHITKHPSIKKILQKRFPFVFVDETQDLDDHQITILDDIFYNPDPAALANVFQRIGDRNQSIFDGSQNNESSWTIRENNLVLSRSFRLNANVSAVVRNFALDPVDLDGLGCQSDGTPIDIPPYLIVYEDVSRQRVIPSFAELIRIKIAEKKMPPADSTQRYHAVGWNTIWTDMTRVGRYRLTDFYPQFSKLHSRPPIDHTNLNGYLSYYDKSDATLLAAHNSILAGLLKILRMQNIRRCDPSSSYFSKSTLFDHLDDKLGRESLSDFKTKLYIWCMNLRRGRVSHVHSEIAGEIPGLLERICGSAVVLTDDVAEFLMVPEIAQERPEAVSETMNKSPNSYSDQEIKIDIGSVHSVKGQTHTATLYIETSFWSQYETGTLSNQFEGNQITNDVGMRAKQAARMVYVGLSRPTHLLAVAIFRERFERLNLPDNLWKIIKI